MTDRFFAPIASRWSGIAPSRHRAPCAAILRSTGQFNLPGPYTDMVMGYSKNQKPAKHFLRWIQYLESDLILGTETEGLTCQGNHPETTQDKKQESKRLQERQEISLGFPWLGRFRHASRRFAGRRASSSDLQAVATRFLVGGVDLQRLALSAKDLHRRSPMRRSSAEIRNLSGVKVGSKPQSIGIDGGIPKIRSDSRY
jgi:hypothetical protein